jgi:hypothetical protein
VFVFQGFGDFGLALKEGSWEKWVFYIYIYKENLHKFD